MIRNWYDPASFSEWLKRVFSLLNLTVLMLTAIFVFSEFRFNWIETVVGRYLASTNESRPKTGAIWETGKQTSSAHAYLNKIIDQQKNVKQTAESAQSFSNLASGLLPGQWVTLEKDQFKSLYLSLEPVAAAGFMEPAALVWLLNGRDLERIFCEGIENGIKIYFIDSQNRVIQQIDLSHNDIQDLETSEKAVIGNLSDIEEFTGRIYPAKNFFDAVFNLPKDMIPDLMQNPQTLLKQNGQMTRVGIWNAADNGYINLGFEFETGDETKVLLLKGREWAVWQLSLSLKGESQ